MADKIREVHGYIVIDSAQETLTLPQTSMKVTELDKDERETIRQKTVLEAYPDARKSVDETKLVIPFEVGDDDTFEEVYTAIKAKFQKPIMAHKETIKHLDNDEWREAEPTEINTIKEK